MESGQKQQIFKDGDLISPVRDIEFNDGTKHLQGHTYYIREGEEAYYQICGSDYYKVN